MTQAARDNGDALARAGKALIARGVDGYAGPDTDAFIDEVGRHHAAGALYREATAEAIALCRLPGASDALIAGIYRNFVWTHFVVKLLMTASPLHAIQYFHSHFDIGELQAALAPGSAIISCFHCTGYPLVALGLAASPVAPLISKARVDFLEKSPARIGERVVYLSDRSAPVQLTRALKQGIPAWIMLDVVLPGMRVVPTSFLGGTLDVSAGMDAIARLSGRPACRCSGTRRRDGPGCAPARRSTMRAPAKGSSRNSSVPRPRSSPNSRCNGSNGMRCSTALPRFARRSSWRTTRSGIAFRRHSPPGAGHDSRGTGPGPQL